MDSLVEVHFFWTKVMILSFKKLSFNKQSPVPSLQNKVYLLQAFQGFNTFSTTWRGEGNHREVPVFFYAS